MTSMDPTHRAMVAHALSKAVLVLGTREATRRWILSPAMGLDGARPNLLRTEEGARVVHEFLMRLELGVYNESVADEDLWAYEAKVACRYSPANFCNAAAVVVILHRRDRWPSRPIAGAAL